MPAVDAATITLRPTRPEDRELLYRVYASTRAEELRVVPWSDEQKEAFLGSQFDAQDRYWHDHYPETTWDVIEVEREPAGRLYVSRWSDEIRIVDITLLPAFRGHGVGSALLRGLLEEAEQSGKPVTVHVRADNPARALYERLGFRPVPEHGVDVFMRREPQDEREKP
jgi:ribosomal protein S18 acetylase RimI-like enzyme